MSDHHADRNLLVGALALQMDFIDRDQLVDAMRVWLSDKDRPLDDILVAAGAIDSDTRSLLTAVVDKHLALHNGNPEHSLRAVSMADSVRQGLAELGDSEIDRTLVFASGTKAAPPLPNAEKSTVHHVTFGIRVDARFEILRVHDHGGIGTVSIARDGELNREVALKEIQEKYASDEAARDRFTLEAEITGGLEHPGIVPVYGFGHYEDGRPFYAMRFIRGNTLGAALKNYHNQDIAGGDPAERAVEFRRLLGHLIDVCRAVHYAHCRGVLHRDIKPSNVMIGKYGETLVVDWGLAKTSLRPESPPLTNEAPLEPIYSSGTDQTRQGTHLGTPAFMSPEQAEGRLDLMDARSDVYSLGATMYQLLTGKRAFSSRDVVAILAKVRAGDFPPPRKVHPDTPAPLDAICLKAMSLRPAGRYASAADLADDIEKWLADEPVTAWREPLAVRTRRWIKRHRTLVSSTAAALVAALAILLLAVGLLNAAKNREADQRRRAEENLNLAKQAVDVMLTEVASEELENVPQMEQVRGKLLAKARDFYETFRQQSPDDPTLRIESALANKRLADIFRLMGEVDSSQEAYRSAIDALADLHQDFPDVLEYQRQLANAYNYLGVLYKPFDRTAALETYGQAIELQHELHERHPTNPAYAQELARSHYNRGIVQTADSDAADQAEFDFATAIELLSTIVEGEQDDADIPGCRQELARCYSNLAILQRIRGEKDLARENYERAIDEGRKLVAQYPAKITYKKELALYHNNLSNLLLADSSSDAAAVAKDSNSQAMYLYAELAEAVPEIRSDLGNIHHSRGVIVARMGSPKDAEAEFLQARATFAPLVEQFPDFPRYADRLGNANYELAKLRYADGDTLATSGEDEAARIAFVDAHQLATRAIAQHQRVADKHPDDITFREHLRSDCFLDGWAVKRLCALSGDMTNVPISHDEVADVAQQLQTHSPENGDRLYLAAELFSSAMALVAHDAQLADAERQDLQNDYGTRAIDALREAVESGNVDRQSTLEELRRAEEPDAIFRPLADREELPQLIEMLNQ